MVVLPDSVQTWGGARGGPVNRLTLSGFGFFTVSPFAQSVLGVTLGKMSPGGVLLFG